MDRKEELLKLVEKLDKDSRLIAERMVEDILFLESQLEMLRGLPFIQVNPNNKAMQKTTPAGKQYKALLQEYASLIKLLLTASGKGDTDEVSPLRSYLKSLEVR